MRKHLAWYLKGLKGSARIKDVIMEGTKRDQMVQILENFVGQIQNEEHVDAESAVAENAS
jgi:tRNA-dihydrouridine synthase